MLATLRRVGMSGTFSKVEILDGVPGDASMLRSNKDSLGEGITAACESKAPFADPGISTAAGSSQMQRDWVGNVGWKWMSMRGLARTCRGMCVLG